MPSYESRWWEPDLSLGEHDRAARGFHYKAYFPARIADFAVPLPLDVPPRFVPLVSLVLATNATRFVDGLTAYRAGYPLERGCAHETC